MFHPRTRPILAALFVASCLATPGYTSAEQAPQQLPAPLTWTKPPEAVRAAATALQAACAAWTQHAPLSNTSSLADALLIEPAEATACEATTSPEKVRLARETSYVVLAAAVVGLALASFVAVVFVLRFLAMWVRFGVEAASDAWPSFRRRYR